MKRVLAEQDSHSAKKHKFSSHHNHNGNASDGNSASIPHGRSNESPRRGPDLERYQTEAVKQLPSVSSRPVSIPAYTPFTVPAGLPPLPEIQSASLRDAPFKHKSLTTYDRNSASNDVSYERLEFLGDAYIELIASRLIYHHFGYLPAGQQSQLRELLVKNETLAEYSRQYAFDQKVEAESLERMVEDLKAKERWGGKGNKGWTKILGDVFEAYVAAVVLGDDDHGFSVVEAWLTALWAPKLLEAHKDQRGSAQHPTPDLVRSDDVDPLTVYNPNAKAEVQKKIAGNDVKLQYEPYKDSVELKGDKLGQNRHFIALYLTGYGYDRKVLGKGEGKNKVEAGNWAAIEALYGECKDIVRECEEKLSALKEAKRAQRAAATQ